MANGSWTNLPTSFTYQWQRCTSSCVAIAGATGTTYVPVQADEGARLAVVVTAANATETGTATSGLTALVAAAPPVNTRRPSISASGTIAQGATLTITGAGWTATPDTTFSVSWERCDANGCAVIAGATGSSYTLVGADVGAAIVAVSTAANVDGVVSARSDATGVAAIAPPRWKSLPTLSGGARVGDSLAIAAGVWTGPVVVVRHDAADALHERLRRRAVRPTWPATRWRRADVGAILRVRETASNAGGDTVVWSTRYIGPVLNATSASAVLNKGTTALKNPQGATLATAVLPSASAASVKKQTVNVKRAAKVSGKLYAWACEAALNGTAAPKCSAKVKLTKTAKLKLPAGASGQLRVVVVKSGG